MRQLQLQGRWRGRRGETRATQQHRRDIAVTVVVGSTAMMVTRATAVQQQQRDTTATAAAYGKSLRQVWRQ